VRAAYNEAQRLREHRNMMQAWANYLGAMGAMGATCLARVGPHAVPDRRELTVLERSLTVAGRMKTAWTRRSSTARNPRAGD
jgi:hypothetical protein